MDVHHNILIFAFRYALGRMSMAPLTVIEELKKHWGKIPPTAQKQIKTDITSAIEGGRAGMDCDVKTWSDFLMWTVKEKKI